MNEIQIDLLFVAVALLSACFSIYLIRKPRVQDDSSDGDGALSLFACPLLANSSNHRLDAALRDAEEGYNRCKICGFENFKRFSSCSICGDSVIEPHAEFVDRIVRNTSTSISVGNSLGPTSRPGPTRGEPRSVVEIVAPHSTEQKREESPTFTERQLRARKRKEWTRKLDIKGEVFWYRDGLRGVVGLRYPGFVAHFQRKRKRRTCYSIGDVEIDELAIQKYPSGCSSTDSMGEPEPALSPQSQLNSEFGEMIPPCKPSSLAMEQRVQELEDETLPTEIKLTDATVVDASRLPLDVALPPTKLPWREILRVASRSFPARYAHFVTSTAALVVPPEEEIIRFSLNRATLFKDSIESLSIIPAKNIRSVMRINFPDETGINAGGLHREWFVLLNEQLVDPKNGVFRCVNKCDQTFYFNSNSAHDIGESHLVYYFAAGRLVGRAMLEGQVLGFHLALPLLKIVLGIPIAFTDLEYFDPELFKSLTWMIDNDVDALGLDFSVTEKRGNDFVVVDLIRNGRNIDVTDDNKDFYLERRFMYLLFESVSSQIYAFLKGLYEVIPQELLMLFDPHELDYLLCGSDEIDVDDWEKHTQYNEELLHHPALTWFWEIVREMSNEYRRRLLQFATGSCRVPIAGFSALTSYDGRLSLFTLKGVKLKDDGYIWGHACFNRLDLPLHTVRDELRAVLYAAIETEMQILVRNAVSAIRRLLVEAERASSPSSTCDCLSIFFDLEFLAPSLAQAQALRPAHKLIHARAAPSFDNARALDESLVSKKKSPKHQNGRQRAAAAGRRRVPGALGGRRRDPIRHVAPRYSSSANRTARAIADRVMKSHLFGRMCIMIEYRLDAALREAEAGYNACGVCGFENFKRAPFCGLCGGKIASPCENSSSAPQVAKTQGTAIGLLESVLLTTHQSQRQERARSRKEWTRKLDIAGKLFWYRDAGPADAPDSRVLCPGYAVHFCSDASSRTPITLAETALDIMKAGLTREVDSVAMVLVDASRADPARLPVSIDDLESKRQVVSLVSLPFPTKYAHFVKATAELLEIPSSSDKEVIKLDIKRERIFQDSIEALVVIPSDSMRTAAIRIHFCDEAGVDAGRLQREWFELLNQCLVGKDTRIDTSGCAFRCVNKEEPAFYLNQNSAQDLGEHHLMCFYGAGRLIGRALLEGNMIGFHLSLPLLKIILGLPVAFSDLKYFDPEVYKSLLWLEETQGAKSLGLTFSITEQGGRIVDLIPNGRHVDVADDNKREYLERRFRYTLFESVSSQLYVFLKGLYEVIPQELLMIFDPEELDYLLCGSDEIDVDEWMLYTTCSENLRDHQALTWFWEIVREMPNEYRRRLLQFATAASRVPVTGFSALMSYDGRLCLFTLKGVPLEGDGHIRSHACFNRLDLPLHVSRAHLQAVLYAAIERDVYGFTTN